MNLGIKGKNALVTGGANGIGKSISEGLASEGANIFLLLEIKKLFSKWKNILKNLK